MISHNHIVTPFAPPTHMLPLPLPSPHSWPWVCFLYICEFASFLFCSLVCCIFLDSTYKWYYTVSFSVWLISLRPPSTFMLLQMKISSFWKFLSESSPWHAGEYLTIGPQRGWRGEDDLWNLQFWRHKYCPHDRFQAAKLMSTDS